MFKWLIDLLSNVLMCNFCWVKSMQIYYGVAVIHGCEKRPRAIAAALTTDRAFAQIGVGMRAKKRRCCYSRPLNRSI